MFFIFSVSPESQGPGRWDLGDPEPPRLSGQDHSVSLCPVRPHPHTCCSLPGGGVSAAPYKAWNPVGETDSPVGGGPTNLGLSP